MSDRKPELNEQQRLAQEAVRSLPRPEAGADFRARLKEQFVAGEIPETGLSAAAGETSGDSSDTVGVGPEGLHLGRLWLGWTGLAAAAVLATALLGFNRLPGPALVATNGVGTVTIAGVELAATDTDAIDAALRTGAHIQVGEGGSVDIVYPGSFVMRAGAGTDLVLPDRPGRWFRRTVETPMSHGELSVRTGPDLAGGGLIVRTEEGRAVIHGTLVSVFRNEDLTCVCLYEGSADVVTETADLGAIPRGMRWVVFSDGSEPQLLDIVPAHQDHMLGLDESCADIFDLPENP